MLSNSQQMVTSKRFAFKIPRQNCGHKTRFCIIIILERLTDLMRSWASDSGVLRRVLQFAICVSRSDATASLR